jgi:asparagine synthase (glutamine-hydrolysing)
MKEMEKQLIEKIYGTVNRNCPEEITISFSGGLDSSLLAKVCRDLKKKVTLLTVGFEGSHDLEHAKKISEQLKLPLIVGEIKEEQIENDLRHIVHLIKFNNLAELEVALSFFYVAKTAVENNLKNVVTASGMDELFCGYEKYKEILEKEGEEGVNKAIIEEVNRAIKCKAEQQKIMRIFGVEKIDPFLDNDFVEFASKIPVNLKMKSSSDEERKHITRSVAFQLRLPEHVVKKSKKAFQYGSGIHKVIEKLAKSKGITKTEAKKMGHKGIKEAYIKTLKEY